MIIRHSDVSWTSNDLFRMIVFVNGNQIELQWFTKSELLDL